MGRGAGARPIVTAEPCGAKGGAGSVHLPAGGCRWGVLTPHLPVWDACRARHGGPAPHDDVTANREMRLWRCAGARGNFPLVTGALWPMLDVQYPYG